MSPEEAQALLGVHARNNLADKPSDKDIQLLKDLYSGKHIHVHSHNHRWLIILLYLLSGNVSCTILGPPPVNPPRPKVSRVMGDDGGFQGMQLHLMTVIIIRVVIVPSTESGGDDGELTIHSCTVDWLVQTYWAWWQGYNMNLTLATMQL